MRFEFPPNTEDTEMRMLLEQAGIGDATIVNIIDSTSNKQEYTGEIANKFLNPDGNLVIEVYKNSLDNHGSEGRITNPRQLAYSYVFNAKQEEQWRPYLSGDDNTTIQIKPFQKNN